MRQRLIAAGVTGLLATAGCTGQSRPPRVPVVASCTARSGSGFVWPAGMAGDLPLPRGATLVAVRKSASGFTVVEFTSPGSVQDSLRFAVAALQSSGYTVGRGEDSPGESHLPFTRDGRPGVVLLVAVDACNTKWQIEA